MILHRPTLIKQLIAYLMGIAISATCTQLLFIVSANYTNYFSGIEPLSTLAQLPWFMLVETLSGLALAVALRTLGFQLIQRPLRFLLLGLAIGCSGFGEVIIVWLDFPEIFVLIFALVVVASSAVIIVDGRA